MDNIKTATFTSVWDGDTHITTNCKVDTKTHEIIDIEQYDGDNINALETLDAEYVTVDDIDYPAVSKNDYDPNDKQSFWYE